MLSDSGAGIVRRPRLRVLVDGAVASAAIDARVVSNNYFSADWYYVNFAVGDDPNFTLSYWASVRRPLVEVQLSVAEVSTFESVIVGYADSVSIDAIRSLVRIEGRDLSALLVDSCLHEAFPNYTADAIVSLLALRHGLKPKVLPTPGMVGRLFGGTQQEMGFAYHSRATTDWDLIVRLAQQSGYDAYVQGWEFYFQPMTSREKSAIVIDRGSVTDLRLERDLSQPSLDRLAAMSWNSQLAQSIQESSSGLTTGTVSGSGPQVILEPNLQPGGIARAMAQMVAETTQQARSVEITMPGETDITARSSVRLQGTSTDFDRVYNVEFIDRMFSPISGFRERIRARQSVEPATRIASALTF